MGLLISASGVISPPVALACGLCFALVFAHPLRVESGRLAKLLLQLSVIALGFGMNLFQVLKVGRSGFLYTAIGITFSLALGLLLGSLAKVRRKASLLISVGTAICGGSAIAAIAPIIDAREDEISVAMGTVFILNSVALFLFPAIGSALHLSQSQFGLWAALAIHDTSSVVGASAKYGNQALVIGTTVKLARALWIIPVSLATAAFLRARQRGGAQADSGSARMAMPWFILFFCLASVLRTFLSSFTPLYDTLAHLGRTGLTATLFLIGTGLSRHTIRTVGFRPFLQGIVLWIIVATLSLLAIYRSIVSL
ncbi:MAG TPA: putative sulfate exporter family transporter [Acidobacteriaceae bacterium]